MAFPLFAPRRAALAPAGGSASVSLFPANTRATSNGVAGPATTFARGREVAALLYWTAALFLLLALASYAGDPSASALPMPADGSAAPPPIAGPDWVGPVGAACARALVTAVGSIAWSVPLELALLGIPYVRGKRSLLTPARLAVDFLLVVIAAALVQVGWPGLVAFGMHPSSGVVGELFGEVARSLFSTIGSFLVGFACLGLLLIARASFSFIAMMNWIGRLGAKGARGTADGARSVAEAWRTARELERGKREEERLALLPHIDERPKGLEIGEAIFALAPPERSPLIPDVDLAACLAEPEATAKPKRRQRKKPEPDAAAAPLLEAVTETKRVAETPLETAPRRGRRANDAKPADVAPLGDLPLVKDAAPPEANEVPAIVFTDTSVGGDEHLSEGPLPKSPRGRAPVAEAVKKEHPEETPLPVSEPEPESPTDSEGGSAGVLAARRPIEPIIVDTSAALEKEPPKPVQLPLAKVLPSPAFRLPSMDYLVPPPVGSDVSVDKDALYRTAEVLIKTLADYKISGKVEDILPGPTVTTFEVAPAAGTKVSRVAALADDLALALAKKVRIVAPIPGKNRIGFELPNEKRVPLFVRDLIEDRRFQEFDAPLPVVLGRDIVGKPVYADLAGMPHVIVAGATGAGKSVGLNVMLTSLLYRRTPEEMRLLMIDPKVVELAPFDRIPHMLLPVVTDMKQASNALKWAVDEMERRYQLFADAGTRNIGTYNGWAERVAKGLVKNPNAKVVLAKDHNGLPDAIPAEKGSDEGEAPLPEKLPYIVIVVDEFADLMIQQKGDVETSVARLAQKARAAGMHVILATQRPSVDVITGMIKANFPTRIAFRVAQKTDSRTILDEQGAEHLLGKGDMLIKLNGTNDTKRVQCPFLSEEEVQAVTDFLRTQGEPVYDENILKPRDEDGEQEPEEDAELDAMYDQAVRLVAETRRCSTSWLQRKLEIGYNRAARIVETMERRGLVGPPNGAKDREVLIAAI
ncbi:MAG TPA: DNA translocase FtsK 4TM domain-containing protein [Polyangiaceae bacterium]|jgi:S-DNA-T family DNA segregation ATPase FtsK/SpoIIIE